MKHRCKIRKGKKEKPTIKRDDQIWYDKNPKAQNSQIATPENIKQPKQKEINSYKIRPKK